MAMIGYARVSTDEQNLDLQRDALAAAGCDKIYEDDGVSAIAPVRPGFEAAIACLKRGDTFVIWKMDRAFRSTKHSLDVLELFETRGIEFRAVTELIDTATAIGKLNYDMRNAIAEFERRVISERTKAGLQAARARGKTLGRRRKLSDAQIAWARQARKDFAIAQIAQSFCVSPRTLTRGLARTEGFACPG